MVNQNYRVDLVLVAVDNAKGLSQVQSQINQWITKQELIKFDVVPVGNSILFKICRLKGKE